MVSVFFGQDWDANLNPDCYFDSVFEYDWLDDPLVKEMVRDIDLSEIVSHGCVISPVLGQIPPTSLSGGVKTCILMLKDPNCPVFDLVVCGENCEKWLSRVFEAKDIVRVSMSGCDLTFKDLPIHGICENDGSVINNWKDWVDKMCDMAPEPENERGTMPPITGY